MVKETPGLGKILTMVGFALACFSLLLFLWLSFGGAIPLAPKNYRVKASFPEAVQLAEQADVRVAGVSVGKVVHKELDNSGNRTVAFIELPPKYAPVYKGAKAILRQKTLLGETYVELTSGNKNEGRIPDGGEINKSDVQETVQLDEIIRALDPKTRQDFRVWQSTVADAFQGRAQDVNDVFGNLPQFASSAEETLRVLDVEHVAVSGLV